LRAATTGNANTMIGAAIALVVLGIILLFLFPWAGIVVGAAGLILVLLFLLGFGRRAATGRP
jgi:NADH:ubiquinone oxidoreductase subunit 3 (subunit A)